MMRCAWLALLLVVSACDARLALTISGDDVDLQGARLQIEVHADDGSGCAGLAFLAAPPTAPVSVAVVDAGSLVVPRVGQKLIVAEAARDDVVVGRGCAEVGDVTSGSTARLLITPTTSLRDLPTTTPVFGAAAGAVSAIVVDANDRPRAAVPVQARVLDGVGVVLVDALLVSDDLGAVEFAPQLHNSGPVVVELVPHQPRRAADRISLDAWVAAPVDDIILDANAVVVPVVLAAGPQFVAAHPGNAGDAIVLEHIELDGRVRRAVLPGEASSLHLLGVHHHRSLGDTDLARDLVWLQTSTRLLVADLETLSVVDELAFAAPATMVRVGDCAAPPQDGPALLLHDGNVEVVDLAFDRITFVPSSVTLDGAVRSGCVVDDRGTVQRLVVTTQGVHTLGRGIASIRVATVTPQPVFLDDSSTVVHIGFRADRTALVVRFDGGSTVLTPHRLVGDTLQARSVDDDPPQRLPATPLLVQQGPLFGGVDDVLTLLPAGGPNDSAALYGRSGVAASGIVGICSPRAACAASVVTDVDDDGVLDLLTVAASGADVRARVVRSR